MRGEETVKKSRKIIFLCWTIYHFTLCDFRFLGKISDDVAALNIYLSYSFLSCLASHYLIEIYFPFGAFHWFTRTVLCYLSHSFRFANGCFIYLSSLSWYFWDNFFFQLFSTEIKFSLIPATKDLFLIKFSELARFA